MLSIAKQKMQLRQRMKAQRLAAYKSISNAADLIADQLLHWPVIQPTYMISLYWPLAGEIDPRVYMTKFYANGGHIALPTTDSPNGSLQFYEWYPEMILTRSKWGVEEPAENGMPVQPDIVILPLLAFDKYGNRLGYGQGHYDRTLINLRTKKKIIAVGLAFDIQKVDLVPHEQHDQKLDYVVTPSTIYEF
jgi:5-formyltetrahydrofolate cyclo-ligase